MRRMRPIMTVRSTERVSLSMLERRIMTTPEPHRWKCQYVDRGGGSIHQQGWRSFSNASNYARDGRLAVSLQEDDAPSSAPAINDAGPQQEAPMARDSKTAPAILQDRRKDLPSRQRWRRKTTFATVNDLQQRTTALLQIVAGRRTEPHTSLHEAFDVMEAWLEESDGSRNSPRRRKSSDGADAQPVGRKYGLYGARQAHSVLRALQANRITDSPWQVPRLSYIHTVLQAYAVCGGGEEAALDAQTILEDMIKQCRDYYTEYGTILAARMSGNEKSAESTQPIVAALPIPPDVQTFAIVANAWAKSGNINAGFRAQQVVDLMHRWRTDAAKMVPHWLADNVKECVLNERILAAQVEAWAKSRHAEAPQHVTRLVQAALDDYRMSGRANLLSTYLFTSAIHMWCKSPRAAAGGGDDGTLHAAHQAEQLLRTMLQLYEKHGVRKLEPTVYTYTSVMNAWSHSETMEQTGEAAQRAQAILQHMMQLYRNGASNVQPNAISFTACMTAWSQCSRRVRDAPERATALWHELEALYHETTSDEHRPTAKVGNAMLAAWCRSMRPDAMIKAKEALQKIKVWQEPDLVSYNTMLDGFAKRGMSGEALELLTWLEAPWQERIDLRPDRLTYNSAMAALSRDRYLDSGEATEKLLRKMQHLAQCTDRPELGPDKVSYTTALMSWSRSARLDKAVRAHDLVREMVAAYHASGREHSSLRPDTYVFTILMQCCCNLTAATAEQKTEAFRIATQAMKTLEEEHYGGPNHVSYTVFMTAVKQCEADSMQRHAILQSAIESCKSRGMLSRRIVEIWPNDMEIVVPLATAPLDPDWYRNVPKRDRK